MEPFAHYPRPIQHAILLVDAHPTLNVLTRAFRRVLRVIVSRVPKANGCGSVEFDHSWMAGMAECSAKTVQRCMAELKNLGMVTQLGDGRDDTGLFTRRSYQLTPELARLLKLPTKAKPSRQTFLSDDLLMELSFEKDQPEIQEEKPETPKTIELPAELAKLPEQLGIKDTGIAKLRGLASQAGYQLQDVVACAGAYLAKGIKGNRAFRYLESMIAKPGADYAGRAGQAGRVAAQADFECRATTAAKKHAGRAYTEPGKGGRTYRFRSDGRVEMLDGGILLGFLPVDQVEQLAKLAEQGAFDPPAAPLPALPSPASASAIEVTAVEAAAPAKRAESPVASLLGKMKRQASTMVQASGISGRLASMKWLDNEPLSP